ncbi:spore protease YyaC [Alkalihalobacterium elongatum]|uniref:spore protease YyaC n=1 Tax=Alkalihalobacterium elongatum TaxID=2675466 RepID=UPI001C1F5CAE|nr:spore protease YyaC [Alkalihalobacterium elongatum]
MILNRNIFPKKAPPSRFHMDEPNAKHSISEQLGEILSPHAHRDLVIVCIGTDRSTGDSLGPLIGTKLSEKHLSKFTVYGTLEHPVHAVNLEEKLSEIDQNHRNPYIIGIDACLGRLNSVGHITVAKGPVKPGAAVNKKLPEVGNMHITGIVNVGGMMEYFVLQNTRLHTVMKMANLVASSLYLTDHTLSERPEKKTSLLQTLKPSIFLRERKETHL